jgi:dihydroflavonol-4-reductase
MNLVTGATGHIGNVVIRELMIRGKKVRAFVLPGEDLTPLDGLDVEIVEGNILDLASLSSAMKGIQAVYHLAGMISIMPGDYEKMRRINVEGTKNVVAAARKARVKKLVYTSSIHALRRIPEGSVIDESVEFDPDNRMGDYDRTKAEASLAVLKAAAEGFNAVIVCPTGVIGPYDYKKSEMGSLLLEWTLKRPSVLIEGSYDFVDVRDVARGHVLAGEKGRRGEVYILSGERIRLTRLMELVHENVNHYEPAFKIPISLAKFISRFTPAYYRATGSKARFTPYSIETVLSNSHFSNAKAVQELGFKARSLEHTISDTLCWFVENRRLFKKSKQSRVNQSP